MATVGRPISRESEVPKAYVGSTIRRPRDVNVIKPRAHTKPQKPGEEAGNVTYHDIMYVLNMWMGHNYRTELGVQKYGISFVLLRIAIPRGFGSCSMTNFWLFYNLICAPQLPFYNCGHDHLDIMYIITWYLHISTAYVYIITHILDIMYIRQNVPVSYLKAHNLLQYKSGGGDAKKAVCSALGLWCCVFKPSMAISGTYIN